MLKFVGEDFLSEDAKSYIRNKSIARSIVITPNIFLITAKYKPKPYSEEENDILKRFGQVFDQSYTRFLDLQKAEAQAREAQIEAALERVRSKTMAMHKSTEIIEVVKVMDKMNELNIEMSVGVALATFVEGSQDIIFWYVDPKHVEEPLTMRLPYFDHKILNEVVEARKSGNELLPVVYSFEEKNSYFEYAFEHSDFRNMPDELKKWLLEEPYFGYSVALQKHSAIFFDDTTGKLFSEKENDVLLRFSRVFEQAYIRFLDLQKAEAQAREAQIEASLEKVRSRSLAMHKSDELKEAGELLWNELGKLGIESLSSGYVLMDKDEKIGWIYAPNPATGKINDPLGVFHNETKEMQKVLSCWKKQEAMSVVEMDEQETIIHQIFIAEKSFLKDGTIAHWITAEQLIALSPKRLFLHNFNFKQGYLMVVGGNRLDDKEIDLMLRFTRAFQQTYTRFLDLKKAEEQARESQIEAALERVRSRTLAMHKSEELAETAAILIRQLNALGIEPISLYIGIIKDHSGDMEIWSTDENGKEIDRRYLVSTQKNSSIKKIYDAWIAKQKSIALDMEGNELEDWLTYWQQEQQLQFTPGQFFHRRVQHIAFFSKGFIAFTSPDQQGEATFQLLERFAAVFNLTYTRFLDLQKAEAQAREATIEAALERVRGKAMAMRTSEDLSATASMVFTELRKLGINPIRCGVGIFNKQSHRLEFYSATSSANGDSLSMTGGADISSHPLFEAQYESWLKKENYFTVLKGDDLVSYYKVLSAGYTRSNPDNESEQDQYGHWLMFSEGFLFAWSDKKYAEQEISILDRFKKIVELTFKRYLDLQKSEANAREAVKQAALDRVRADIASMRTTSDLQRITPLVWNELTIIGIPFIRCGVFIMDEEQQQIHTFLSTPDGKAIAAFHLPYNTPGNFAEVVKHWHQKKKYVNHWGQADFLNLADSLVQQGAIATREQYISSMPKEGIHLHFLPFVQGMLYVGNTELLNDDALQLVQNLADAFSTAYARYEDFNKLEAAKQTVEKTLVDLKQAQQQLVQSEKMASLGELTAGIAHEIQNPLNFVNNFSEVSNELIDEMTEELDKGDIEEAKAIANDIKQNLEKINHHGKRADGIVKGMLQHSRSSSGQKELTDINVLTDEYVRLCYHGLRAKDKSFNAAIKTDFDNSVEKINIIPQDIGRVILNLLTNAFYAVNEKKKANTDGYEPTVAVSTKKADNKIIISVKDNGNGIPQKAIDKIFQPFFTTKPTGQGTGLGLSLSYDIIKAHGGEIKVETKEGEGTEFVIQVPVV